MKTMRDLPDILRRALALGALPAALGLLTLPGCGSLTAGGLVGEASVTVSGDAPDAAPAPSAAPLAGMAALQVDAVRRTVPAQRYSDLRIVFTDIKVEVDRGLVVDGRDVTGEIRVELEDGPVTVERSLPLDLGEGQSVELLLDLNTQSWLRAVDPDLHRVDYRVFAEAIAVRIR